MFRKREKEPEAVTFATKTRKQKLLSAAGVVAASVYAATLLIGFPYPYAVDTGDGGTAYRADTQSVIAGCGRLHKYDVNTLKYEKIELSGKNDVDDIPQNIYKYPVAGYYVENDIKLRGDQAIYPTIVNYIRSSDTNFVILYSSRIDEDDLKRLNTTIRNFKASGDGDGVSYRWNPALIKIVPNTRSSVSFIARGKYQTCTEFSAPALKTFLDGKTYNPVKK